ncbi:MAG: RdgB/HAM1 family non-canonical purine NTP pyrophosphatase [Anaerolineaceae bacterium]
MKKLLIATNNLGKIAEIRAILSNLSIELIAPIDLSLDLTIEEDGKTYYENALKKAIAYYQESGLPTLADDSGLEVDALNGDPGIRSRRYSPDTQATDMDRCTYLVSQLKKFPRPWKATFHCEIVLLTSPNLHIRSHGICSGQIIPEPRGENGFGYDPIFLLDEYPVTMAELPDELKNQFSHRAQALQAALTELECFAKE